MPAIVEGDDDGIYVLKFRGAGQGTKALIAEILGGEIARALELPVPELVLIELDTRLGRNEPDYEIRELINASAGTNLGLDYLPGSITLDPVADAKLITSELASRIVWLDALLTNVDRSARNANMLIWHKQLWLIDHGAALFFHHSWKDHIEQAKKPFTGINDHVLLSLVSVEEIRKFDLYAKSILTDAFIASVAMLIPDGWLSEPKFTEAAQHREAYVEYLSTRLASSDKFIQEIEDARTRLV